MDRLHNSETQSDQQIKQVDALPLQENFVPGLMKISDDEFRAIRDLVYDRFGINLTDAKRSLVVGRLQKIIRTMGMQTFKQYYDYLVGDKTGAALDSLINRISTNHTFFYRESSHFEFFRATVLPEMSAAIRRQNSRDLRVWCAGCSSGEEPYMLTMEMMEYFGNEYGMWEAGVLATDISARALEKAVAGIYPDDDVNNVPTFAKKYFSRSAAGGWSVVEKVKREVTFRRLNLMNATFPFKKSFHAVFCRNVMIYFDQQTRAGLIKRFHDCMVTGAYLFIGHSESLGRDQGLFEYIMPAVYRRRA
ncbi:CheR family methyltransferase [Thermodesulfobacteriota bacterium]